MPPPDNPPPLFALYVSAVAENPVTRFAADGRGRTVLGAVYVAGKLVWNEDAVIALSVAEVAAFGREYRRAITEGSLRERTAADYAAWRALQKAAKDRAAAKTPAATSAAPTATPTPAAPVGGHVT